MRRHQPAEDAFPFQQRQRPQVPAIELHAVEGVKVRLCPTVQELIEDCPAIGPPADDLAIQDDIAGPHLATEPGAQPSEAFESIAVAGDELALAIFDIGQRPEAVVFDLEDSLRVIEGFGQPPQRHRLDGGKVIQ